MSLTRRALLAAAAVAVSLPALAQGYPNKPVKVVVPFAPGGTTDIVLRIVAANITEALGQPMIIENKAGAGGAIGALDVIRSAPDGYTLSAATVSTTAAVPAIRPNVGYDPTADFVAVTNLAATPNLIAVHPSFPAKDYKGFIAELMKNPEKYSYASSGTGGIGHLQTELFKSLAKVKMTHIPYKGAGPALNDVAGGQVPIIFDNMPSAMPFVKQGRLIPIAVAAPERLKALPDVPTFKELGLEPVNRMAYYGILAPKGTPKDVIDKIHAAAKIAVNKPEVRAKIEETGSLVVGNSPAEFTKQIAEEFAVYKKVVADNNIKPE